MLKAIAVLRTMFLGFILGYAFWATPLSLLWSSEAKNGNVNVNLDVVMQIVKPAWIAIAWIALETAIGWFLATRKPRPKPAAAAPTATP